MGYNALTAAGGDYACAFGMNAAAANTANSTIAFGYGAATANTSGARNLAIGYEAYDSSDTENDNIAIGYEAMTTNTAGGTANTALGNYAGDAITSGDGNICIGHNAGSGISTGVYNTIVGYTSGINNETLSTGQDNVLLGAFTDTSAAGGVNQIAIGYDVNCVGNNYVTIGKTHGSANQIYNQFTSNATWTHASDQRMKKEITTNTDAGLDFINDLRTVTYKWKAPSEVDSSMANYDASKTTHDCTHKIYGLIAQEVKTAMDTHSITDFGGWHESDNSADDLQGISYEMFVMPLIKAIQELSAEIEILKAK